MQTFTNITDAKNAADKFFNENFEGKNGASFNHDRMDDITDEEGNVIGIEIEYHSADDSAMDDTFVCQVKSVR